MKKIITLIAAAACMSFSQRPEVALITSPVSGSTAKFIVNRKSSFPTNINWSIGYNKDLPMVTLTWPAFSMPGLGPVDFTFLGSWQYINPTTTTSIYWAGTGFTLTANTSYTMNIAGVNYYFYWPGNGSTCVITGHS